MGVGGADVAQFVERRTGRFDSPMRQEIFLPESTLSAASLTVSVQPSCAFAGINICAHVEDPTRWQPYLCLDTRKYRTHC